MSRVRLLCGWLCGIILFAVVAGGTIQPLFGMGQPPAPGDNPQATGGATEGALLAKEVVARMDQAYYRLWQDQVNGFDAVHDVNENGRRLGTIQISFNAGADGTTFKAKLPENTPNGELLDAMLGRAWLESLFKKFSDTKAVATRIEDSFNLFAKDPEEDISSRTLAVSGDYRLLHEYEAGKDLSSSKLQFKVQSIDGKYFPESVDWQYTTFDAGNSHQMFVTYQYTYARREGVPFIRQLHITLRTPDECKWDLELKSVTFRKAVTPAANLTGRSCTPGSP